MVLLCALTSLLPASLAQSPLIFVPVALSLLCAPWHAREATARPAPTLLGALGAGVLMIASVRLMLTSGLSAPVALSVPLLTFCVPAMVRRPPRFDAALYLLLALGDPLCALVLPGPTRTSDPVVILESQAIAAAAIALLSGWVLMRPGLPAFPAAAGAATGGALAIAAIAWDRWPAAVALSQALVAAGGSIDAWRRLSAHRRMPRVFVLAPAALLAVVLRAVFPGSHGIAPATVLSSALTVERRYGLDATVVLSRWGGASHGFAATSLGVFPFTPGDLDVFAAAPLAITYSHGPRAAPRSCLLIGDIPASELDALMAADPATGVASATPSPLPWNPPRIARVTGAPEPPYDLILVNVTGRQVERMLPALPDLLAPDGLLIARRLGPPWEQGEALTRLIASFPERQIFWDNERSGLTLLSRTRVFYDPDRARLASAIVARRFPALGAFGMIPTGAWLEPAPGIPDHRRDKAARMDLAEIHLACGAPHDANVILGPVEPDQPAWQVGLRALIQAAMGDPTDDHLPELYAAEAVRMDPTNPFLRRIAVLCGVPVPVPHAPIEEPIELVQIGDEVPGWITVGPIPVAPGLPPSHDYLEPGASEQGPAPGVGDAISIDAALSRNWAIATHDGEEPGLAANELSLPGLPLASCSYAFTHLLVRGEAVLSLHTPHTAIAMVDGASSIVRGDTELPLGAGEHRILVKLFAPAHDDARLTAKLEGGSSTAVLRGRRGSAAGLVSDRFAASPSCAAVRSAPERRLVAVSLPPVAEAIRTLAISARGGPLRHIDLQDPAQVVDLGDPGRHLIFLEPGEAVASELSIETTIAGTTIRRSIAPRRSLPGRVFVVPVVPAGSCTASVDALRASLTAVQESRSRAEGFRVAVASASTIAAFLATATAEDRTQIQAGMAREEIDAPALFRTSAGTVPAQLLLDDLDRARDVATELGAPSRVALVEGPAGLPPGLAQLIAAAGVDAVIDATPTASAGDRVAKIGGLVVARQPEGTSYGAQMLSGGLSLAVDRVDRLAADGDVLALASLAGAGSASQIAGKVSTWNATFARPTLVIATAHAAIEALGKVAGEAGEAPGDDGPGIMALAADPQALGRQREREARAALLPLFARCVAGIDVALDPPVDACSAASQTDRSSYEPIALAIAGRLPPEAPGLLVLNPLPFERREVVFQGATAILAEAPPMGYRAIPEGSGGTPAEAPEMAGGIARSRDYELALDRTGRILRLLDRSLGAPIASDEPFLVFAEATAAGPITSDRSGLAFAMASRIESIAANGPLLRIQVALGDATGAPKGMMTLDLPGSGKRLDVTLAIPRAAVTPGSRGLLLFRTSEEIEDVIVERSLGEARGRDLPPMLMRGGFTLVGPSTRTTIASRDAAVVLPSIPAVLLYDDAGRRIGRGEGDLIFRFSVTSSSVMDRDFTAYPFFRSVEVPLCAFDVSTARRSAGDPLPPELSAIEAMPDAVELIARRSGPGPSSLTLLVRNMTGRTIKQRIVFPPQGSYLSFPMDRGDLVTLDVDPTTR